MPVTAQTACFPECANVQCAGATTWAVVPMAGDVWLVVPTPASLCLTLTTNLTTSASPTATGTTPIARADLPPVLTSPPPSTGGTKDLALGLGLGLGIRIPLIFLGAVALKLVRRQKLKPEPTSEPTEQLKVASDLLWIGKA